MTALDNSLSPVEFKEKVSATLDRLNQTGNAEVITVDGATRAVLLSPSAFDEMERELMLARDVAAIQRSREQIRNGEGMDANEFFDQQRAKLLAMKAEQSQ
jgi:PHD/YefM family antitoxin component YafN of YafNO toxin-antitoxin module